MDNFDNINADMNESINDWKSQNQSRRRTKYMNTRCQHVNEKIFYTSDSDSCFYNLNNKKQETNNIYSDHIYNRTGMKLVRGSTIRMKKQWCCDCSPYKRCEWCHPSTTQKEAYGFLKYNEQDI